MVNRVLLKAWLCPAPISLSSSSVLMLDILISTFTMIHLYAHMHSVVLLFGYKQLVIVKDIGPFLVELELKL